MALVKCVIYLTVFDDEDNDKEVIETEHVLLDLDGDIEAQVFDAFPYAESFSWEEAPESDK